MKILPILLISIAVASCAKKESVGEQNHINNHKLKQKLIKKQKETIKMFNNILKYGSGAFSYKKYAQTKQINLNYNNIPIKRYKDKGLPHTIYALIDFSCAYSKKAFYELNNLVNTNNMNLNIVYLIFPMDPMCNPRLSKKMKSNKVSCKAAKLALCGEKDNKFIETVDYIFNHKENLSVLELKYKKCLNSKEINKQLAEELNITKKVKFRGLPYILLDKKPIGRLYHSKKHFFMLLNYLDKVQ